MSTDLHAQTINVARVTRRAAASPIVIAPTATSPAAEARRGRPAGVARLLVAVAEVARVLSSLPRPGRHLQRRHHQLLAAFEQRDHAPADLLLVALHRPPAHTGAPTNAQIKERI